MPPNYPSTNVTNITDEFYTKLWSETAGLRFGDMADHFPAAIPIGIMDESGSVALCPHPDFRMTSTTALICIAEDDDLYDFVHYPPSIDAGTLPTCTPPERPKEKVCFSNDPFAFDNDDNNNNNNITRFTNSQFKPARPNKS